MSQGAQEPNTGSKSPRDAQERSLVIGDTVPIRLSAGHRILHHSGKCSQPHGHNYKITVKLTGNLTDEGWIADKGSVTDIVEEWDHKFLVEEGDPLIEAFKSSNDEDALEILEHPPTAEMMSVILEDRLTEKLSDNVTSVSVSVAESAELSASQ